MPKPKKTWWSLEAEDWTNQLSLSITEASCDALKGTASVLCISGGELFKRLSNKPVSWLADVVRQDGYMNWISCQISYIDGGRKPRLVREEKNAVKLVFKWVKQDWDNSNLAKAADLLGVPRSEIAECLGRKGVAYLAEVVKGDRATEWVSERVAYIERKQEEKKAQSRQLSTLG